MKVAILQSNYIPWKGYFDMMAMVDVFVLYDEVQYTKNDWRNRNKIIANGKPQWITIPVRQNSLDQRIDETEIVLPKWPVKHWKTIQANYGKAPFFKEYGPKVEALYEACKGVKLLSEINFIFIKGIAEMLGVDTELKWSTDLDLKGDKNERLIDAVKKCGGTRYVSGPAAKSYLDVDAFSREGIEVEWMDYSGYKEYPQSGEGFEHGVSVLDLIFNVGDSSRGFLKF